MNNGWLPVEDGGNVKVSSIIWTSEVRPVKITSGKGKEQTERTVFNFLVKTGFYTFKSLDYTTQGEAQNVLDIIKEAQ